MTNPHVVRAILAYFRDAAPAKSLTAPQARKKGVSAAAATMLVLQCACSQQLPNNGTESTAAASGSTGPGEEAIVPTTSNAFVEVTISDLKFHVPKERIKAPGTLSNTTMSWFLSWPGLTPGFAAQPDAQHFLQLIVGSTSVPTRFPVLDPDAQLKTWVRGGGIGGPKLNPSIGLIEYVEPLADGKPGWHFYRSPDPKYLAEAGDRPLVRCQPTPHPFWGNTAQCEVYGRLSSSVDYKYSFSETLLPEWPAVDVAVRAFLTSMIVRDR